MIEDQESGNAAEPKPLPVPAETVPESKLIPPLLSEFRPGVQPGTDLTQNRRTRKSVRWTMVVTLGGSLGLLLFLAVSYTRNFMNPEGAPGLGGSPQIVPFKLTERAVEKELREVIESQLSAFREGDYPTAYNYAASGLKAQITLPAFERMVKTSYPVIAQSRSAEFGVSLDNGHQALVNVTIVGRSGRARHYQYILEREGSIWRIFGVKEVRPEGTTV
jgi:hypothetical protein